MKPVSQLFRQIAKTLVGVLLIALALSILIISTGQYTSTNLAQENLSDGYSTVALISDEYYWETLPTGGKYIIPKFQIKS